MRQRKLVPTEIGRNSLVDIEMIKLLRDIPAYIELLEQIQHTSMHKVDIRITRGLHASRSSYDWRTRQIGRNVINHPIVDRD